MPIELIDDTVYGLDRCPHCEVAKPLVSRVGEITEHFVSEQRSYEEFYRFFTGRCSYCNWLILFYGSSLRKDKKVEVYKMFPSRKTVSEHLPAQARRFLEQAIQSLHAPDGSLMLTSSAVDAMLKDKGYINGSLYERIEQAVGDHLITAEMGDWSHEVRLAANGSRHADLHVSQPQEKEARISIEFAEALAEYLYVLPAKVRRWKKVN